MRCEDQRRGMILMRVLAPIAVSMGLAGFALVQQATAQNAPPGWTVSTTQAPPPPAVTVVNGPGGPAAVVSGASAMLPERVGRVAAFTGAAQIWDSHDRQWTPLQFNRLVTEGDRIRSAPDTQIEVQIGTLAFFVGPQSDVEFSRLDGQGAQVRLNQGHLVAKVRTPEWARDLQLVTGELAAQAAAPGLYRLDRDTVQGGRSAAAALRGVLVLGAVDSRLQVAAGQRIEVMGAAAGGGLRSTTLLNDAFAAWVGLRDQAPDANAFAGVAPLREMTGLDALDRHGRWESHPDVGWVWYPVSVRPGWEPFRDGRWVWVKPWGWTWVDETPWGFAPSHYGRWLQWNNRWVWSPGPVRTRPLPPVTPPHVVVPPVAAPVTRPRDDLAPGEWRPEHENRSVRTPRVDPWNPGPGRLPNPPVGVVPGALPPVGPAPAAGSVGPAPALGTTPPGAATWAPGSTGTDPGSRGVDRPPRPERRHGFERPPSMESPAPDRAAPSPRVDRPEPGRTSPAPQERERGERPDRPRQLAQ